MIISRLYLPGIRASSPAMPSMVGGRLLSLPSEDSSGHSQGYSICGVSCGAHFVMGYSLSIGSERYMVGGIHSLKR